VRVCAGGTGTWLDMDGMTSRRLRPVRRVAAPLTLESCASESARRKSNAVLVDYGQRVAGAYA
jgi:hypothetical protein